MTSHPTPSSCKPDVLGEVRNLAWHGRMYVRDKQYGFAADAFQAILDAVDRAASAVSPSQAQSNDGELLREAVEFLRSTGDEDLAAAVQGAIDALAGIQSPAAPVGGEAKWICPRCKVDRFKEACPGPLIACPMKADAQAAASVLEAQPQRDYCPEKLKPGGCQLHNLHCGYPKCNERPAQPQPSDQGEKKEEGKTK